MTICAVRVLPRIHNRGGGSPVVWNYLSTTVLLSVKRNVINRNNNETDVLRKQFDE